MRVERARRARRLMLVGAGVQGGLPLSFRPTHFTWTPTADCPHTSLRGAPTTNPGGNNYDRRVAGRRRLHLASSVLYAKETLRFRRQPPCALRAIDAILAGKPRVSVSITTLWFALSCKGVEVMRQGCWGWSRERSNPIGKALLQGRLLLRLLSSYRQERRCLATI